MEKVDIDFLPLDIVKRDDGFRFVGVANRGFHPDKDGKMICTLNIPLGIHSTSDYWENLPKLGLLGRFNKNEEYNTSIFRYPWDIIVPREVNHVALNFGKNAKGAWEAIIFQKVLLHKILFKGLSIFQADRSHHGTMGKLLHFGLLDFFEPKEEAIA